MKTEKVHSISNQLIPRPSCISRIRIIDDDPLIGLELANAIKELLLPSAIINVVLCDEKTVVC